MKGFFNSFRDPYFITYHKTLLFPPKTTLIGLIVNAMGKTEKDFYEMQDKIKVGIVLEEFSSKGFDLWRVRKGKEERINENEINNKKEKKPVPDIVMREFLIEPKYFIYISTEEALLTKIKEAMEKPKRYYYLGRDDEFVNVNGIKEINFIETKEKKFKCVLPFDVFKYKFKKFIEEKKLTIAPEVVRTPLKFEKGKKGRIGIEIASFTQYYGFSLKFEEEIDCFKSENENIILF